MGFMTTCGFADIYDFQSRPNSPNTLLLRLGFEATPKAEAEQQVFTEKVLWTLADSYYPFDINVTMDEDVFANTPANQRAAIGLVGNSVFGGVAGGQFGEDVVVNATARTILTSEYVWDCPAQILVHEMGHVFGLVHDECPSNDLGFCASDYYLFTRDNWATSMGSRGQEENCKDFKLQWYNGYKNGAHNQQEDMDIIANQTGWAADDIDTTQFNFSQNDTLIATENQGIIENGADKDYFKFETSGGMIDLIIGPRAHHSGLKVQARILDEQGFEVMMGSEVGEVNQDSVQIIGMLGAGSYYLEVDGVGKRVDGSFTSAGGFTDYGSVGLYQISGHLDAEQTTSLNAELNKLDNQFEIQQGQLILQTQQISQLSLFNSLGQILLNQTLSSGVHRVDLTPFSSEVSLYMVFKSSDQTISQKIMVE